MKNEPIKQCCKDLWEVIGKQQKYITELEKERDELATTTQRLRGKIKKLKSIISYCCSYLDGNPLNSIGHGSKAHMELKDGEGDL
jgi:ABC-type Fe3+-hydroxamate transport system substrate-binding protein